MTINSSDVFVLWLKHRDKTDVEVKIKIIIRVRLTQSQDRALDSAKITYRLVVGINSQPI